MRSTWTLLVVGGLLGSVAGVIGATISDPEMGFPAWVISRACWLASASAFSSQDSSRPLVRRGARLEKGGSGDPSGGREQRARHASLRRGFSAENVDAADEIFAEDCVEHAIAPFRRDEPGSVHGPTHARETVECLWV